MEEIAVAGICIGPERPIGRGTVEKSATLVLCSHVAGRDRWHVDALQNSPRLAATVELVLRTEEGIKEVRANPVTGRVLVCYAPELLTESVETLIRRALGFGPMSREEFSVLRSTPPVALSSGALIAAELGCSALRMILLGGVCPMGLAATALFFLFRSVRSENRYWHPA
jgi:hypothetical protein